MPGIQQVVAQGKTRTTMAGGAIALAAVLALWISWAISDAGADPPPDPSVCITGNADVGPEGSGACEAIPTATGGGQGTGLYRIQAIIENPAGPGVYVVSGDDRSMIAYLPNYQYSGALGYYGSCMTGSEAATAPAESPRTPIPIRPAARPPARPRLAPTPASTASTPWLSAPTGSRSTRSRPTMMRSSRSRPTTTTTSSPTRAV